MISPQRALSTLTDEDEGHFKREEARVNAILANYDGKMLRVTFANTIRRRVLNKICAVVREAGWLPNIVEDDQYNSGLQITFDIASPPRSGP